MCQIYLSVKSIKKNDSIVILLNNLLSLLIINMIAMTNNEYLKDFVPHPLSFRMKALGFDEPCVKYYWTDGMFTKTYESPFNHNKRDNLISAPTFSQAFRFFRNKYSLHSHIDGFGSEERDEIHYFEYSIYRTQTDRIKHAINMLEKDTFESMSYQEAELACLEKLLEIVENEK